MNRFLIFICLLIVGGNVAYGNHVADAYISRYKDIAISEMHRTGIPASIKLAQGLLESDWGRSDLATLANNHFGIKCGGSWDGKTYYKEDDDRDDQGNLIQSCFRSFDRVDDSYIAHSDFLTDPRKAYRYGQLFYLDPTDYKSWAKGLRKSGYATDPKYPQKLISIIEKYQLHRFDTEDKKPIAKVDNQPKKTKIKDDRQRNSEKISRKAKKQRDHETRVYKTIIKDVEALTINRCRIAEAKAGQTISDIASQYSVSTKLILEANEMYLTSDDVLKAGDIVYLEKKKRRYNGAVDHHLVQEGETMKSISQIYGIRLSSLYAKNKMPKQSETIVGERLALKETVKKKDRPRFVLKDGKRNHTFLFQDEDL